MAGISTSTFPYTGTLSVDITALEGTITIYLINADDIEIFKRASQKLFGGEFKHYPNFHAEKTHHSSISARLNAGSYYLILYNSTLGIFFPAAVDVEVRVSLQP